jgi:methyl-accepting chemotaxis protein
LVLSAWVGLLGFGAIYEVGSWSQDGSRAIAGNARTISDLNKRLSIEMLEARRAEKDFQLRRELSYSSAMPSCLPRSTTTLSS